MPRLPILLTVVSLVFLVAGLLKLVHDLRANAEIGRARATWKTTTATIFKWDRKSISRYDRDKKTWITDRWAEAMYTYFVDDVKRAGNWRDLVSEQLFPDALPYTPGQTLPCYYDPANPDRVVLYLDPPDMVAFTVFAGVLIVLPLLALAFGWIRYAILRRRAARSATAPE